MSSQSTAPSLPRLGLVSRILGAWLTRRYTPQELTSDNFLQPDSNSNSNTPHVIAAAPHQQSGSAFFTAASRVFGSKYYSASTSAEAPYGFFRGRHIIGENTRIQNGIFIGADAHEAIVVDSKYGKLDEAYRLLTRKIRRKTVMDIGSDYLIFRETMRVTRSLMRYSENEVKNLTEISGVGADQKIALDVFVHHKIGSSRHQVLLAAYLLERLIDDGLAGGSIALETGRNGKAAECLTYTDPHSAEYRFEPYTYVVANQVH